MNWIELTAVFAKEPEDWSPIVDLLGGLGCPNTLQDDSEPSITACIVELPGSEDAVTRVTAELRDAGAIEVRQKLIVEEDWIESFKKHFRSRRIGEHFVIVPTWEEFVSDPGDHVIRLDPGQAFGTGDHPTTRMCIELMERAELAGKKVADVGTGTGVLSIAAVMLGAQEVAAVDIEPLSVEVAKENAVLNNVTYRAIVGDGIGALSEPLALTAVPDAAVSIPPTYAPAWDVVISNIISSTLINIAPEVAIDTKPSGLWIVSGIIADNWPDVEKTAKKVGFELVEQRQEDLWVAATFRRLA